MRLSGSANGDAGVMPLSTSPAVAPARGAMHVMDTTPDRDGLVVLAAAIVLCILAVVMWATPVDEARPAPVEEVAP